MTVSGRETATKQVNATDEGKYRMQLLRPPYAGTYQVEFVVKDKTLILHGFNGYDKPLKQEAPDRFFFADVTDQQLKFERDKKSRWSTFGIPHGALEKRWYRFWINSLDGAPD